MTPANRCTKRSLSQLTIIFAWRKPLCAKQSRNWHVAAQRSRQPERKQKQKQSFEPRRKSSDWPRWKLFSPKPKPRQDNEPKKKSSFAEPLRGCTERKRPTLSVLRRQRFACVNRK